MAKFFDLAATGTGGSIPFTPTSTFKPSPPESSSGSLGSSRSRPLSPFVTGKRLFGGATLRANPGVRTGTQISEFGRQDFDASLVDWNRVYQDAQQGLPAALELIEQFAPGGGFGTGRRLEARELIGQGVARDTAAAVASGLSSTTSARGLNVLAGRELATQFGNIEDQRAQLQIAAFSPYTQMLSNLAQVGTARPTPGQFIERIATPEFAPPSQGTTTQFLS